MALWTLVQKSKWLARAHARASSWLCYNIATAIMTPQGRHFTVLPLCFHAPFSSFLLQWPASIPWFDAAFVRPAAHGAGIAGGRIPVGADGVGHGMVVKAAT